MPLAGLLCIVIFPFEVHLSYLDYKRLLLQKFIYSCCRGSSRFGHVAVKLNYRVSVNNISLETVWQYDSHTDSHRDSHSDSHRDSHRYSHSDSHTDSHRDSQIDSHGDSHSGWGPSVIVPVDCDSPSGLW